MRGIPAPNLTGFMPWQIFAVCALILAGIVLACRWSWRRREAHRTHRRYRFDDSGRMLTPEPPPPPHASCTRLVCFQPEHSRCTYPYIDRTP